MHPLPSRVLRFRFSTLLLGVAALCAALALGLLRRGEPQVLIRYTAVRDGQKTGGAIYLCEVGWPVPYQKLILGDRRAGETGYRQSELSREVPSTVDATALLIDLAVAALVSLLVAGAGELLGRRMSQRAGRAAGVRR